VENIMLGLNEFKWIVAQIKEIVQEVLQLVN